MKNFYIILILFLSFTIYSCAKKSDSSSSSSTTTELEGTWQTPCHARGSKYMIRTLTVSGTNVTDQWKYHFDSSCDNDSYSYYTTHSSLSIGDEYTDDGYGSSGGSGHQFTMTIDTNTYTSLSASDLTWVNDNSYCGETGWELNTAKDVAGKTCDGDDFWNTNITIYGLYMFDGNKLFHNFTSGSYPSSNNVGDNDVFTKQ